MLNKLASFWLMLEGRLKGDKKYEIAFKEAALYVTK
jgi:hypothetical protein